MAVGGLVSWDLRKKNSNVQLHSPVLLNVLNSWEVSGGSHLHSRQPETFNSGSRCTERLVPEVRRVERFPRQSLPEVLSQFGCPVCSELSLRTSGKSQMGRGKRRGHLPGSQRKYLFPTSLPFTPLLRRFPNGYHNCVQIRYGPWPAEGWK